MKTTLLCCLTFCLSFDVGAENNACPNLWAYPEAELPENKCFVNPDVSSNVTASVERNGYNIETHSVTTDDGYILTIFEISSNVTTKNVSVFLQHGLRTNSFHWVNKKDRSLALYLAKMGYKVFLGNTRGTTYSMKHQNLTVDDPIYWHFNLDTLAGKDMVTQLEFAYKSGGQKMHYMGHSMGTTLALMFACTFDDKADQWIETFSLFSPVTYVRDIPILEVHDIPLLGQEDILKLKQNTGLYYNDSSENVEYCKESPQQCRQTYSLMFGQSTNFPDEDLLLYFSNTPSGIAQNQILHYGQIVRSDQFQKFDYGPTDNLKLYGAKEPPIYNLSKVRVRTCLFYGENDPFIDERILDRIYDEIGSELKCKLSIQSETGPYNHQDFLYGQNLSVDLYSKVLTFINDNTGSLVFSNFAGGRNNWDGMGQSGSNSALRLLFCIRLSSFIYSYCTDM